MNRFSIATLSMLAALMACGTVANAAPKAQNTARERLDVYTGVVDAAGLREITALGVDRHELQALARRRGARQERAVRVEAILSGRQADALRRRASTSRPRRSAARPPRSARRRRPRRASTSFASTAARAGCRRSSRRSPRQNPKITKLVNIGKTVNGQDIVALKVSKNARTTQRRHQARGALPRRAARPRVDHAGDDPPPHALLRRQLRRATATIRRARRRERAVVRPGRQPRRLRLHLPARPAPVAQEPARQQRRRRRSRAGDGVDLNRNFPTKWGYDNEGSSPDPGSETLPRHGARLRARDEGARRAWRAASASSSSSTTTRRPSCCCTASAGRSPRRRPTTSSTRRWRATTPTRRSPGYDPDISAELYTTNGDTDTRHAGALRHARLHARDVDVRGRLGDAIPTTSSMPSDCGSGFEFPDDEALDPGRVREEHPVRAVGREVRQGPRRPGVGRSAARRRTSASTASTSPTATRRRSRSSPSGRCKLVHDAVPHQRRRARASRPRPEWQGGERYGDENDDYYVELRGIVRGTKVGDKVEVWFTRHQDRRRARRAQPALHVHGRRATRGADVLVIANEDYTGVNPTYPAGTSAPKYAGAARRGGRRRPATRPTSGTSTRRACRTTSAC